MIKSPYNFVPLNEHVYLPTWAKDISHDIPFPDGEDGWIEVVWHSCSPLFVRDTSTSTDKSQNVYSMHLLQPDGSRLYFIPGSSLKGMLRSVMSIMSFGKMECDKDSNRVQYNNSFFGYRIVASKNKTDLKGKDQIYKKEIAGMQFGWLKKEGEEYKLYPCAGEASKVGCDEIACLYPNYKREKDACIKDKTRTVSAWKMNEAIDSKCSFPKWPEDEIDYRIVATGTMHSKKHELLLPVATTAPIVLSDDTMNKFLSVYAPTPDFDKFVDHLEAGNDIPVGFVRDKQKMDGIKFVGMGKMMRVPYAYGVKDLVERKQDPNEYKDGHDLCETIFGWADTESSMKGRVQVCHAFATQTVKDDSLMEASGVLGEPRASFYPLYLKQSGGTYSNYDDPQAEISGRKRYRVHKGSSVMPLSSGNDNENTKTTMKFVPSGCEYKMRINVHNLRKVEIGALLSVINLHGANDGGTKVWHNIGCAKSFGYGKITAASVSLHGLKWSEREYMADYEMEMDKFVRSVYGSSWLNTEQMTRLMGIMTEHDDSVVEMMELNDYGECKKSYDTLSADVLTIGSLVSDEDRARLAMEAFHNKHSEKYAKVKDLATSEDESDLRQAAQMVEDLKEEKLKADLDTSEEDQILASIHSKQDDLEKAKQKALEEAKAQERLQRIGLGFDGFINEQYTDGPNAGKYKVNTWKLCRSKVDKWFKDKGCSALDSQEVEIFGEVIKRLMANPDKKEKKDWGDSQSKLWKEIRKYISDEKADALFNSSNG